MTPRAIVSGLVVVALAACEPAAGTLDGGRDAPPARDAGFDPASLEPCVIDPGLAFDGAPHAAYAFLPGGDPLAVRALYPLVVLDADASAGSIEPLATARRDGLRAAAGCAGDDACVEAAIAWSAADAGDAAEAVVASLAGSGRLAAVAGHLRGSGVCALLDDGTEAGLVTACVADALLQASAAISSRVLPELDDAALDAVLDALLDAIAPDAQPLWGPVLALATLGLRAADRDEAARYEPLAAGENAAAIARLATLDLAEYEFAAIVVPGQGPEDPDLALHPGGRARAELAHARWAAGLAPVVLVSGGHVHPDRTRFSEAIEMKRFLVESLGMPEDAILVDPYARHTTTNLRNATRILVRAGVPTDRPILVTSDLFQSVYIASSGFAERCDDELGYRPFAGLRAISRTDACFLPVRASLHVDARDPLDP